MSEGADVAPPHSINVNDPGLITLVNKLQDVFNTVGVSYLCGEGAAPGSRSEE